MRHAALLYLLLLCCNLRAQVTCTFHDTPLLDALRTIDETSADYQVDILTNGLDTLRTSAQIKNLDVPAAVKRACNGLPVKVKVKDNIVCVQFYNPKKENKSVVLQGNVQDGFLERGLFGISLALLRDDSTIVESKPTIYEIGSDSMHITTMYYLGAAVDPGRYLVRAQKDGYDDGWAEVEVPANHKGGNIKVPMINMRRSMKAIKLGEVEIVATRIKVRMRGDTLVYDARAFQLPQGSMLGNLIDQLPGARLTEQGEIFINGRKIDELTLNSRSLFRGNKKVLLENLPYFTVKELKVFERENLEAVARGIKDAPKDYVMDVALKDEYSTGLIGNADLGVGTHERYVGRAFGILLTKTLTLGAFVNMNNTNDRNRSGSSGWGGGAGGFTMGSYTSPQQRVGAGLTIDYKSTAIDKEVGWAKYLLYSEISFDRLHIDNESQTWQERFLPQGSAFSRMQQWDKEGHTVLQAVNQFRLGRIAANGYLIAGFREQRNDGRSDFQQWDDDGVAAMQQVQSLGRMRHYGIFLCRMSLPWLWNKGIDLDLDLHWTRAERDYYRRQNSTLGTATSDYRHEYDTERAASYHIEPTIGRTLRPHERLELGVTGRYRLTDDWADNPLFVLSNLAGWGLKDSVAIDLTPSDHDLMATVLDPTNSSYYDRRQHDGEVALRLKLLRGKGLPFEVRFALPLLLTQERMDYRRAAIDTLARRTGFFVNPSLSLRHDRWRLNLSMRTSMPAMLSMMPMRDARNPLSVREGNPDLKNDQRLEASFSWNHRPKGAVTEGRATINLSASATYHLRSTAQGFTYDAATTAYTYRPENVRGNWSASTTFGLSLALGSKQRWWLDSETSQHTWHSVDYASVSGMTEAQLNKIETVNLGEMLKLRYTANQTKLSLAADVRWRRSWGHHPSSPNISALDTRLTFTAQQTLQRSGTSFALDAALFDRRGYSTDAMNRTEWLVNATVTQPIPKTNFQLRLEAHDLFNQTSNTEYEVNAQGRTETWHRVAPNYVMLHLLWQFSRKPRK
ncbi:MAG: outer membrane beta-barrel family protein [Bacteroidaceae bacterium]|nr:outer membrane beta-barrel family protein [Bacteroidaceae bacterium]